MPPSSSNLTPVKSRPPVLIQSPQKHTTGTALDRVWLFVLAPTLIFGLWFFASIFKVRQVLSNVPDVTQSPFTNLYISCISTTFVFISKQAFVYYFRGMFDRHIKKLNYPDHEMKVEKNLDYAYGVFIYTAQTQFAVYNYWGAKEISYLVGGTGDNDAIFGYYPYTTLPNLDAYYQFAQGYHFHNLVQELFFRRHRVTYIEMSLHHIIAQTLIFLSYYTCMTNIGCFVLLLHDVGDIWLNLAKITRDMNLLPSFMLDIIYVFTCFFWIYPRVVVPMMTYVKIGVMYLLRYDMTELKLDNQYLGDLGQWGIFIYQWLVQTALCGMNVFWSCMLIEAGVSKFFSKKGKYVNDWEEECKSPAGEKDNKKLE